MNKKKLMSVGSEHGVNKKKNVNEKKKRKKKLLTIVCNF